MPELDLYKNDFQSNLCADIQINDHNSFKKIHFITVNGQDTNKLEQSILRNFMMDDFEQSKVNLRSLTQQE